MLRQIRGVVPVHDTFTFKPAVWSALVCAINCILQLIPNTDQTAFLKRTFRLSGKVERSSNLAIVAVAIWPVTGQGFRNTKGAFHLGKKLEISVVAKVEFPIGKKLFHLVVNLGTCTWRCPIMDLELV